MSNEKQQTAVDSIIEFCQKQMDNDSSIHKGVYLSIIKFCKEQITQESEVHWKTTLITSKPMEMTNNKQETAVEMSAVERFNDEILIHLNFDQRLYLKDIYNQVKEIQKDQHIKTWEAGLMKVDFNEYYEQTYGGNK
jgi:regulator of sigma D